MLPSFNSALSFFHFIKYNNFIFNFKSVVTFILSGYLYAVGGHDGIIYLKTVERYNPVINEWTYVASMEARRGGVGVATLGGCLYATGGYDGTSNLSTSGMSWLLSHAMVKPVYYVVVTLYIMVTGQLPKLFIAYIFSAKLTCIHV